MSLDRHHRRRTPPAALDPAPQPAAAPPRPRAVDDLAVLTRAANRLLTVVDHETSVRLRRALRDGSTYLLDREVSAAVRAAEDPALTRPCSTLSAPWTVYADR